ncbi:MAG TPA: hypothetical protein VMV21_10965, partial [Vicinamibacteria bacterium]|nr:hypothetical protein [Vicinamibacteria bacterium]
MAASDLTEEREGREPPRALLGLDRLLVVAATLYLLGPAFLARPRALGDSGEYLLAAESLFNHASADLRDEDVRSLVGAGAETRIDGALGSLYDAYRPDRDGRAYGIHFWAYSLLCVPAKLGLRLLGQNELKALQVTNALVFLLAVIRARRFAGRTSAPGFALATLLLLSPAAAFVLWPHPEAFCSGLVVLSLVLWREGRITAAVALTALASVQNPPLVLLALFLWWEAARAARARAPFHQAILFPSLALLPAVLPFVFYLGHFGRLTPLVDAGA